MIKARKGIISILAILILLSIFVNMAAADSTPPRSITGLKNVSYATSYINWTWKDPTNSDFAKVKIYIDGVWKKDVLKGVRYYRATGLLPNTSHTISTRTVDTSGNINKTWVNLTRWTKRDTSIPKSITGLKNISYALTYINWTWTDSVSSDFSKVIVYIDGTLKGYVNKGVRYFNATGFSPDTSHTISTRTMDTSGNINKTWVNRTARTAGISVPPTPPPTEPPLPPIKTTPSLGIFYYPWTGGSPVAYPSGTWRHWLDDGHNPPKTWAANYLPDISSSTTFDPYNRLYSAKNTSTINKQLGLIEKAGIGFIISSWWGQNSYEDQALDIVDNIIPNYGGNIKFAIYYEKEGFADVPKSEIISDINYIKTKYASNPYYLKINDKPVIFVYNADAGLTDAQKWKAVRDETGIYTVLKVFGGYQSYAGLADSWHQYAPTTSFEQQGSYSAFISPGYHKWHEQVRLERENFTRFENDVIKLKNSNAQFKLIETWNEWGEGTGIEPAQKIKHDDTNGFTPITGISSYGTKYVDILGKYFAN